MIAKADIREAIRSLYSAKQRTVLALIGIVIGIGSVIAMVSIGTIVSGEMLRHFREMGTDILTIRKEISWEKGKKPTRGAPLNLKDVLDIPVFCPSVSTVAPFVAGGSGISYAGVKIENSSVVGATASFYELNRLRTEKGRLISDLDEYSHFCVVGNNVYQKMRRSGAMNVIGERIRMDDRIFTVVGALQRAPEGGLRQFDLNDSVYIHIATALRMKGSAELSDIIARIRSDNRVRDAQREIRDYFAGRTRNLNVKVTSAEELIQDMQKQYRLITLFLSAIGSISLIVGGVGIMNVMLVSVTERRKEIGLRRALGARRSDIKNQFLTEAVILSLAGGFFGILLGIGTSFVVSSIAKWHFSVSLLAVLLGVCVSSAVGIFFGLYPANQASKLDPIVALRAE